MTLITDRPAAGTLDVGTISMAGVPAETVAERRNGKVKPATVPTRESPTPAVVDTLRTLAERLQTSMHNSSADSDPEMRALLGSVQRRRLEGVNAALKRIEEGKYGICTDCDQPIENDRLVLKPVTTRCTRCQAVAEWRGIA